MGDSRECHDLSCWWNVLFCGESQPTPSRLPGEASRLLHWASPAAEVGLSAARRELMQEQVWRRAFFRESVACIRLAFTKKGRMGASNSSHKTVAIARLDFLSPRHASSHNTPPSPLTTTTTTIWRPSSRLSSAARRRTRSVLLTPPQLPLLAHSPTPRGSEAGGCTFHEM